jgi:predicted  nucleic acid-binding Zn-ribbon protein
LQEQAKTLTEQNTSAQTEARNAKKKLADTVKELASLRKQIEEKNAELRAAQDMMAQVQKEAKEAGAKTRVQGQNLAAIEQKA